MDWLRTTEGDAVGGAAVDITMGTKLTSSEPTTIQRASSTLRSLADRGEVFA